MKKRFVILAVVLAAMSAAPEASAQDKLYPNTFPLGDVKLLDGPFKHAQDLNIDVLLKYDVDRLFAPFLKEAGLPKKAESFPNWIGLDGHVGGHYLSAMAINYATTGNAECKKRMDYIISELKRCQDAYGNGYVGGVPDGMKIWDAVKNGNPGIVWKGWVPWYNLHKTYAGLRDAWLYGNSDEARKMFLDLCDWGLTIINPLSDEQMEQMLACEFGGMDEVYADAYQMTGDKKYLKAAQRFSHKMLLDSMEAKVDNLDNKHANTQVPKVVGYARIAELSNDNQYKTAADFFWNTVVYNRSLSFGGNSRREHFATKEDSKSYVEDRQGPETCNTYNMLKLTEDLFRIDPQAKYADFYERAMFNHILSTQHPDHGGYVYFTSARPSHYRVYSTPNCAMWCCVGSGMENHGKYGEFIYTHSNDSLFVNLFVASELSWKEKGVTLVQNTSFPDKDDSKLTIKVDQPTQFKLLIRHPKWAGSDMKVVCGGKNFAENSDPSSYIVIDRVWKNGDVVTIKTPMHPSVEVLENVPNYISILYGPIVLGAKTTADHLDGLLANDSRFGQIADGPLVSTFDAPYIIGSADEIAEKIKNMKPDMKPLTFRASGLFSGSNSNNLVLEPFFRIHDSRYVIYWLSMEQEEYKKFQQEMMEIERKKMELDQRTVDRVAPGEQQPEADHKMKSEKSTNGNYEGESWRDAQNGGFFQYTMATQNLENLSLMVRYWGNESEKREFDILVDGKVLTSENTVGKWRKNDFVNVEYAIPAEMLRGKSHVDIAFRAKPTTIAGGIFYVRLLKSGDIQK